MFHKFRHFCESHFSLLMIIGLGLGLIVPFADQTPDIVAPIILTIMMGFSYSRVTVAELKKMRVRDILSFYVLRFLFLPALLFLGFHLLFPDFQYAVLLLALLPMAVSGAALAVLLGGNASLALTGTVFTSVLAPFMIPLAFSMTDFGIVLDTFGMFRTLALIIFVPAIIYFGGIRHFPQPKLWVQSNAGFFSVLLFSLFVVIVVAKLRAEIFAGLDVVLMAVPIFGALFFIFYALGWVLFRNHDRPTQISYALFSGGLNIGLGISLAILYFPAYETLLFITCEFIWILSLSCFQLFLKKQRVFL